MDITLITDTPYIVNSHNSPPVDMTLIIDTHYRINSHNSPPLDMTLITDTHYPLSEPTNFKNATLRKKTDDFNLPIVNLSYTYNMYVNILAATAYGICTYHSHDQIFQSLW